jgi:hypothetical protein
MAEKDLGSGGYYEHILTLYLVATRQFGLDI